VLKKALPPGGGGWGGGEIVRGKAPPLAGRKYWTRRLRSLPKVKATQRVACESCGEIPCLLLGMRMEDVQRKPAAAGKQRASLHTTGMVNADETGRSRPIGATCRTSW
jgi:hypothetical protein